MQNEHPDELCTKTSSFQMKVAMVSNEHENDYFRHELVYVPAFMVEGHHLRHPSPAKSFQQAPSNAFNCLLHCPDCHSEIAARKKNIGPRL